MKHSYNLCFCPVKTEELKQDTVFKKNGSYGKIKAIVKNGTWVNAQYYIDLFFKSRFIAFDDLNILLGQGEIEDVFMDYFMTHNLENLDIDDLTKYCRQKTYLIDFDVDSLYVYKRKYINEYSERESTLFKYSNNDNNMGKA